MSVVKSCANANSSAVEFCFRLSLNAALTARKVSPPMCIAAMYSAADGILNARFGVANNGADASITSGATGSDISVTSCSEGSSVDKSISSFSGSWWILALTSVMTEPA